MKRLKQSQKLRIILSGVTVYTTAKQIRYGSLYGLEKQVAMAAAAQKALDALEHIRNGTGIADQCTSGLAGKWEGIDVQIDITN